MAFYPRKRLTDLWKPGYAAKDCDCICCKNEIKYDTPGWIASTKTASGYYTFLCFLCYDTWTSGDVTKGLSKISRFRIRKDEQKDERSVATKSE